MRRMGGPTKYDSLIRGEITNHLIRMCAFGELTVRDAYMVPPITIVDEITEKYLIAAGESERLGGWPRPFDFLRWEIRFEYGTPYMANLLYRLAEYFEHMYTKCITCPERVPEQWCDMEPRDIRKCIEREENRFWANAAAPHVED